MTTKNGLTLTMIFKANSANYGDSIGNNSILKKITDTDGKQHTYISRQAIRYNIVNEMHEPLAKLAQDKEASAKAVIQYAPDATIQDSPEIDLFGYLKTRQKSAGTKRSAVVRLSHAMGQDPYLGDTDFMTNGGLADRLRNAANDPNLKNSIVNTEIDQNYYVYTIAVDLDQVGIDDNNDINLSASEKSRRIQKLLDTIQYLYRDIRGRRENFNPLFVIGGLYEIKNPFFESIVKVKHNEIQLPPIVNTLQNSATENTHVGLVDNIFDNEEQIKTELKPESIEEVFSHLKKEVESHYASSQD